MTKRISTTEDERRGVILLLLSKSDCTVSDRVLVSTLNHLKIPADLGTVRADLAALEAEKLVSVEVFDGEYAFHIATVTKGGRKRAKTITETNE